MIGSALGFAIAGAAPVAGLPSRAIIPFTQAPQPVRIGLIGLLRGCHERALFVRAYARFATGPIGGPQSPGYMFAMTAAHWRAPPGPDYSPTDGICSANYAWFAIWVRTDRGKYKRYVLPYSEIYYKGSAMIVRTPDFHCTLKGALDWDECWHFVQWDSRAASFRAITPDMLGDPARAWAPTHGYKSYY